MQGCKVARLQGFALQLKLECGNYCFMNSLMNSSSFSRP